MNTSVRSCLSAGVAMIGVSGLVMTTVNPHQTLVDADHTVVALTAQMQSLPEPVSVALASPLDLVGRQATFHVELVVDFLVTGAQLAGRIPPVAGDLLQDIQSGTSLPTAVRRAVLDVAEIEFDAGRELVGFTQDWANFQIQFLRDLVSGLPAGPVGQLLTATLDVAAQIVEGIVEFSDAVITAAEAVVDDVLGDSAEAVAPTQAVAATAATRPPVQETRRSADLTPTETAEPASEDTVESEETSEEASEDVPVVEASSAKQPRMPHSIVEIREAGTAGGEGGGNEPTDATDTGQPGTEESGQSDTGQSDTGQSDTGQSGPDKASDD